MSKIPPSEHPALNKIFDLVRIIMIFFLFLLAKLAKVFENRIFLLRSNCFVFETLGFGKPSVWLCGLYASVNLVLRPFSVSIDQVVAGKLLRFAV
jgi:hypothetical protein